MKILIYGQTLTETVEDNICAAAADLHLDRYHFYGEVQGVG